MEVLRVIQLHGIRSQLPARIIDAFTNIACQYLLVARDRIREIYLELSRLAARRDELERELASLEAQNRDKPRQSLTTIDSQIDLFLRMFCCRESVYPKLWENRAKGTSGYSPACENEWVKGVCGKPPHGRVKCSECPNQAFPALDEAAVKAHLNGQAVIGTYAIREDDTCVFLACDFDGLSWQEGAFLYKRVAAEIGVESLVERSRSGNGAHVWIFFDQPIVARMARTLGTLVLSKCGELNHRVGLESFDRFFPNQDYLPKGGFGNLIALPFQKAPAQCGNTLFVDESLRPLEDQWEALTSVRRVSLTSLSRSLGSVLVARKDRPEDDLLIAELLATDESRNRMIAVNITEALGRGRFPLVLADRKDQLKTLESFVRESDDSTFEVFCLDGVLSAKRRRQMLADVSTARASGKATVIFATASLVGEGFDLPALDTLFLAAPISFEGRLIQYVGRLERTADGKLDVEVFDYADGKCPVLLKMHRGRLKTFQKLGYDTHQALPRFGSKADPQRNLFEG